MNFKILWMALLLLVPTLLQAEELAPEVSALLLSQNFSQAKTPLVADAAARGRILRISSFYVVNASADNTYVYAVLEERKAADFQGPWILIGEIVAHVVYGPQGEVGVDSAYFKPQLSIPGGASVGN